MDRRAGGQGDRRTGGQAYGCHPAAKRGGHSLASHCDGGGSTITSYSWSHNTMTLRWPGSELPLALAITVVLSQSVPAQVSGRSGDPVTTDPVPVDTAHPPRAAELAFLSQGSRLNGFLYVAAGK